MERERERARKSDRERERDIYIERKRERERERERERKRERERERTRKRGRERERETCHLGVCAIEWLGRKTSLPPKSKLCSSDNRTCSSVKASLGMLWMCALNTALLDWVLFWFTGLVEKECVLTLKAHSTCR